MGRTACTEPLCLYKSALYLYFYLFIAFPQQQWLQERVSMLRLYVHWCPVRC